MVLCLLSSHDSIVTDTTLHLELLQPLDGCVGDWHGGGHKEHARQQSEDEEEPLGIHGGCRGVRVRV